jgi:hypothetical protein
VYYAIAPANLAFFGPLLAVWILPGLWAARRWPMPTTLLIVGWAAIVYAFHAGAPWQNFRFTLAYLPPLAILAAAGLGSVARLAPTGGVLRLGVIVCASVGLLTSTGAAVRLVERFIDTKEQELALVHWVESQTGAGAQLFTFGPTLAFRHYSSLPTLDLFELSPADIDAALAKPAPDYVLVNPASIEGQWLGESPWTNFLRLRAMPGSRELGSAEGYTLYRVGAPGP